LQIGWCAEQAANFQQFMRSTRDPEFVALGTWPER
jgi:DNA polymerase-3 subunit epsilon